MNILPGLKEVLFNKVEEQTTQIHSENTADFVCKKDAVAYDSASTSKSDTKTQRGYIPLKTIGNVNYVLNAKSVMYPWAIYDKMASSTKNYSEIEEQKSLPDRQKDSSVNQRIFESSESSERKALHKPSPNIDDQSDDLIETSQDKPRMQQKSIGKVI
jgi:hypothetical protein